MADLLPPPNSKPDLDPAEGWICEENDHPIEQVRLTVDPYDNPKQAVLTIRTWILGTVSCVLLSFANKFFGYRTNQLFIGPVCVQIVSLPIGRFLASSMPKRDVRIPLTGWSFSLNPGPFNMKEHCLITIFANSGAGGVYSVHIVTIVRAFYRRKINLVVAFLLAQTTQLLGYGWAGIYRKYLVESPYMWWPANLVQVSLFKALHQKEKRKRGSLTRFQFFVVIFAGSFAYYAIPGYLFPAISTVSILCLFYKNSVTIQQIGSGMKGLGIGSFGLDWSTVAGFLGSPLGTPASAIFNIMAGYVLVVYGLLPLAYWTNIYDAKKFPLISSHVFDSSAKVYNTTRIIDSSTFTLNVGEQESYSKINMSIMFAICYGLGFATLTSSIMHVALYDGKDILKSWRQASSKEGKVDVHTRLMRNYEAVPQWWFYLLLIIVIPLSIFTCVGFGAQLQLPWWGILLACAMALFFTLPIGVINATTNQQPGLNIITEYIIGLILPGKPLANVTFKTYGYISMAQALSFLADFNLGHYMKVPPKAMFIAQLAGTVIASTVYFGTAWFLLDTVENICDPDNLPEGSPWTCPGDDVFYNASIIWGLVGPIRMFGKLGIYPALNYFFVFGLLLPIPFWWLARSFPRCKWLKYIHIPLILGGAGGIPPAHTVNYITWGAVGIFFNYYIYNKYKQWWARHTYVMSAALDAGVAFMGVLLFFALQYFDVNGVDWWGGNASDFCDLAGCPTAPGIEAKGCPVVPA